MVVPPAAVHLHAVHLAEVHVVVVGVVAVEIKGMVIETMTILLDIDGVLVTTPSWKVPELNHDGFLEFNSRAESNLIKLISETNASIVLTTTHRITYSIEKWKGIFNNRGIAVASIEKVNSRKTIYEMLERGVEINEWVEKAGKDKNYVIIDDDQSIHALPQEIKERWVMTKPMIGLDEEGTNRAIEILKRGL